MISYLMSTPKNQQFPQAAEEQKVWLNSPFHTSEIMATLGNMKSSKALTIDYFPDEFYAQFKANWLQNWLNYTLRLLAEVLCPLQWMKP